MRTPVVRNTPIAAAGVGPGDDGGMSQIADGQQRQSGERKWNACIYRIKSAS
jgi:hypothetical protein